MFRFTLRKLNTDLSKVSSKQRAQNINKFYTDKVDTRFRWNYFLFRRISNLSMIKVLFSQWLEVIKLLKTKGIK